jgi:acetyl-CoA carboxylase carboxyl transferase subunit alpha
MGGAHLDYDATAQSVKAVILKELAVLNQLSPQERINERIDKFCSMGVFIEG